MFLDYQGPKLFENFETFKTQRQRMAYLEAELCMMAREGQLYVTDLYNQRLPLPDMCGSIILGRDTDEQGNPIAVDPPPDLEQYRVKLKSLKPDRPIRYELGYRPSENKLIRLDGSYAGSEVPGKAGSTLEPIVVRTGKLEVEIPLKHAWLALRQHGAWCARARRQDQRENNWLFEEVRPDPPKNVEILSPEITTSEIEALKKEVEDLRAQVQKRGKRVKASEILKEVSGE